MSDNKQKYIALIQKRSNENEKSLKLLFEQRLFGNCISILRQELDSFIRIIYLGEISDFGERERLISQTLSGEKWTISTINNKKKQLTDKDMVEKSTELKGYIQYVYKFGCGFIHLSDFHDYTITNPFEKLDYTEQFDIALYLHQYHGFSRTTELTINNISYLIPDIFEKISKNMAYYFDTILNDGMIEM